MGKQGNIPFPWDGQRCADRVCAANFNLLSVLTLGATMAPDRPVRDGFTDRGSCDPLVVAVVPLDDVVAALHLIAEPGQLAGALCPLEGRAEHRCKCLLAEDRAEGFRFTLGLQRQVCAAGVPSIESPFRCPMAQKPELALHQLISGVTNSGWAVML